MRWKINSADIGVSSVRSSIADIPLSHLHVCFVPIVLQKSQHRARQFSRQKMKQATIADCYGVRLVKEVAGEFIVR